MCKARWIIRHDDDDNDDGDGGVQDDCGHFQTQPGIRIITEDLPSHQAQCAACYW